MTRKTAYLLGIILTILIGIYFYITCCNYCNQIDLEEKIERETVALTVPQPILYPFPCSDGDFRRKVDQNLTFNVSF